MDTLLKDDSHSDDESSENGTVRVMKLKNVRFEALEPTAKMGIIEW